MDSKYNAPTFKGLGIDIARDSVSCVDDHIHDVVAIIDRSDVERTEAILINGVRNGAKGQEKLTDD